MATPPTTATNLGTVNAWTAPSNAITIDTLVATSAPGFVVDDDRLLLSGFGFSIPGSSYVQRVTVTNCVAKCTGSQQAYLSLQVTTDSGATALGYDVNVALTTTLQDCGPVIMNCGLLTPALVNSPGFGILVTPGAIPPFGTIQLDGITVTITHVSIGTIGIGDVSVTVDGLGAKHVHHDSKIPGGFNVGAQYVKARVDNNRDSSVDWLYWTMRLRGRK